MTPRQFWASIALQWFPHRHDKTTKGQHARGMIRSMIAHGKAWRRWAAGTL